MKEIEFNGEVVTLPLVFYHLVNGDIFECAIARDARVDEESNTLVYEDVNSFEVPISEIDVEDVLANPEKYADYQPPKKPSLEDKITELLGQITSLTALLNKLSDNVTEVVKKDDADMPTGDYLNPMKYVDGMEIKEGLWYYMDDKDLPHEAIRSGASSGFYDKGWFDFVE